MLTDIFAYRYSKTALWEAYTETVSKLLVQAFRLVEERVIPIRLDDAEEKWKKIHDDLSMEFGVRELSPRNDGWNAIRMDFVCNAFMMATPSRGVNADEFIKHRLSFIELAFRMREEELRAYSVGLAGRIIAAIRRENERMAFLRKNGTATNDVDTDAVRRRVTEETEKPNADFRSVVLELNERFRRAGTRLNYHNGFIQLGGDELAEREVERPFWSLVAAPKWKNVDTDMKEAFDRRDAGDRDPAFYAAKALESTIKIISDDKGWTHGGEKGAHSYIDNLGAGKNGQFVTAWERDALKSFFTCVRNPLGHGPGNEQMPELIAQQTNWTIETCMSWIKSLIERL
jgi:hypothetical protein